MNSKRLYFKYFLFIVAFSYGVNSQGKPKKIKSSYNNTSNISFPKLANYLKNTMIKN